MGRFFNLGNRVSRQFFLECRAIILGPPPEWMFYTKKILPKLSGDLLCGLDYKNFWLEEQEFSRYSEFIRSRLMGGSHSARCVRSTKDKRMSTSYTLSSFVADEILFGNSKMIETSSSIEHSRMDDVQEMCDENVFVK
ncbi:hypothetical protein M9H77_16190 [Catharanthus roseus]|uniref:Uncharacterized protein n=1 Tax=Catharanthus roseus TaxID=4058 RepID=A0ACC0B0H3_CATRO|nr:hypothetical protein M9H77_16190 [Catharanthus roseus]